MTAKRFIIFQDSYDDLYIQDKEVYRATGIKVGNEENVKYNNVSKIVELLNELHEENKTFREALQELKEIGDYQAMTINELHEENQSLKFQLDECQNHKLFSRRELEKENEQLRHDATILIQSNQDYRKENEQLKQRNKNQYEQLIGLWKLIEDEDYNTLRSMLNQLEEDEERLQ